MLSISLAFYNQVVEVPGWKGKAFTFPEDAWDYYETKRIIGELEYLTRPSGVTATTKFDEVFFSVDNPWPQDAGAFAVFHGTKIGPFKTW